MSDLEIRLAARRRPPAPDPAPLLEQAFPEHVSRVGTPWPELVLAAAGILLFALPWMPVSLQAHSRAHSMTSRGWMFAELFLDAPAENPQ